ncbi:MAG: homoserine kinase, partial [Nitrospinota bacterium]
MAQKVPQTLPSRVHLRVPATTANLGPGYDTLGLALTLYNDILLERQEEEGISIEVEGEGKGALPIDASNIVFQAMQSISEQAGTSLSGIKVTLINRIPLARGLGSSAAALVGGLVGANLLLGEPLPQEELVQMAVEREGHPDNVLPAFYGGGIIAVTVDGRVEWTRFSVAEQFKFVVVIPEFPVETARARAVLPPTVPHQDAVFNVQRVALLLTALAQGKA